MGWGLDGNLWQGYLTYVLIGDENPYTLSVERREDGGGTLSQLARRDLAIFRQLFTLDFGPLETELGTDCFPPCAGYQAPAGTEREPAGRWRSWPAPWPAQPATRNFSSG